MTDYYVAPAGGNGTGTIASPWVGFGNINWGGMSAGDSLTLQQGTYYEVFTIQASGTATAPIRLVAGGSGITIDGRQSFNGAWTIDPSTLAPAPLSSWQLVSGDIWKKGAGNYLYAMWVNDSRINPMPTSSNLNSQATIVANIAPGEWTMADLTTDGLVRTIYWRSPDGRPPVSFDFRGSRRDLDSSAGLLVADGRDYLEFQGAWNTIGKVNHAVTNGGVYFKDCDGVTVVGILTGTGHFTGMRVKGGSNCRYKINMSNNIGGGVAFDAASAAGGTNYNAANVLIFNSTITHNGTGPRYNGQTLAFLADCDGIGVGHDGGTLSYFTVRDCKINYNGPRIRIMPPGWVGDLNRGSGIYIGTTNTFAAPNVSIINCELVGNMRLAAIIDSQVDGLNFRSNLVKSTISLAAYAQPALRLSAPTATVNAVFVEDNIFTLNENPNAIFVANTNVASSYAFARNQFDINPVAWAVTHLADFQISIATANNVTERESIFFGTNPGRIIIQRGGFKYTTVATWQAASSQGTADIMNPAWQSTWPTGDCCC